MASGVCAIIVVSEVDAHRISVFKRCDGALLRALDHRAAATVS
jgi:hypothetical protein